MRRIQLVLAALAIVVTSFAAFAGPAMANGLDCHNAKRQPDGIIRCDNGNLYAPFDRVHSPPSYNDFLYPPVYSAPFYYDPYWYWIWDELD